MAEEKEDKKTFKVEDRRTSHGGGKDEGPAEDPGTTREDGRDEEAPPEGGGKEIPDGGSGVSKVDFSTFVFSLFSSALIQMGNMADPLTGQVEKNLQAAQQTIDIVDILVDKTKGNLSEEEERLIKSASAELKWKYLDAVKEQK